MGEGDVMVVGELVDEGGDLRDEDLGGRFEIVMFL